MGGVDDVSKLAEGGDLKAQLAQAAGVDTSANGNKTTGAAAGGGKSVQDRCKELMKRCEEPDPLQPQCKSVRPLAVGLSVAAVVATAVI